MILLFLETPGSIGLLAETKAPCCKGDEQDSYCQAFEIHLKVPMNLKAIDLIRGITDLWGIPKVACGLFMVQSPCVGFWGGPGYIDT